MIKQEEDLDFEQWLVLKLREEMYWQWHEAIEKDSQRNLYSVLCTTRYEQFKQVFDRLHK
jgi:hypothetical protein